MSISAEEIAPLAAGPVEFTLPLILRGEVISSDLVEYSTRTGGTAFATPDVHRFLDRLPTSASSLRDLHELSFDDVLQFLEALAVALDFDSNAYLQQAYDLATLASGLSPPILEHLFRGLPRLFAPDVVRDVADRVIGIDHLQGWVPKTLADGRQFSVRAFGARAVHIIAGNLPNSGASTIIRSAITRSDSIIKTPSNDPATASAVAHTMCELDPTHPLSRHIVVAYWKGGDAMVEDMLYDPRRVEKLIAWGGESSMRHVRKYIQPGLDLIALDPKLSSTVIGEEALADAACADQAAELLAADIGGFNQQGCVNARVVYVQSGTDEDGIARLRSFGHAVYAAIQRLPRSFSTPAIRFDPELRAALDGLLTATDWYEVIGAEDAEGAIIVSLQDDTVDFAPLLGDRVANLVPIDDLETALRSVNAYTQTIGVYPERLKAEVRDRMALQGAQRIVSLGHAVDFHMATPQDGMEPLRRMLKWVVDEQPPVSARPD